MLARQDPEQILDTALDALATGSDWRAMLDELPVPIYMTDAEGAVTYWNRACVELAGREPAARPGPLVRHLADLHHRPANSCRTRNARWREAIREQRADPRRGRHRRAARRQPGRVPALSHSAVRLATASSPARSTC